MQPMVAGTVAPLLAAPLESSLGTPRLGRIGRHCQQFLPAESELFDRENNGLFLNCRDPHAAQRLANSYSVLLLRRDIPHNGNRSPAVRVERHGHQLEVGQQGAEVGCRKQRDERIAPSIGVVLEQLAVDENPLRGVGARRRGQRGRARSRSSGWSSRARLRRRACRYRGNENECKRNGKLHRCTAPGATYGVVRATYVCTWNSVLISDSPAFALALVLWAAGWSLIARVTGAMIRFSEPTLLRNWPTAWYPPMTASL